MNSVGMSLQKFYKFCEWLKRQPQPVYMSYQQIVSAYNADTGETVSTSTVSKAVVATGVKVMRSVSSDPDKVATGSNRVSHLAGVVRRAVLAIEAVTKKPILSDADKAFLTTMQNGKRPVTPADSNSTE
jgi:hypothetical protein